MHGYLLSLASYTVYKLYKNSNLSIEKYVIEIFKNLLHVVIFYVILSIGAVLVSLMYIFLILNNSSYSIMANVQILITGLLFIPAVIFSISEVKENEITKFIKALTLYILFPLVCIAFVIVYLYIAKIIAIQDIPSNEIFGIMTTLFIFSFPTWIMALNYNEENKFVKKITSIMPYAFIPFIILQIYSITVRCMAYGITPSRYLGCALIIFEIVAVVFSVYKKREKLEYIVYAFILLALIVTVSPLNLVTMSNLNQKGILEKTMTGKRFEELSNKDKEKASGAYIYLDNLYNKEKYIPNNISEIDKMLLNNYHKGYEPSYVDDRYDTKTEDIYFSKKNEKINVSKYTMLQKVNINKSEQDDLTKVLIGTNIETDIKGQIDHIIEMDKGVYGINNYLQKNNIIKIDKNKDLYITNLSLTYNIETKEVRFLNIAGYLLEY